MTATNGNLIPPVAMYDYSARAPVLPNRDNHREHCKLAVGWYYVAHGMSPRICLLPEGGKSVPGSTPFGRG